MKTTSKTMCHENKELIVMKLCALLKHTRAGEDIKDLVYDGEHETVEIIGDSYRTLVNVACDSGIALIKDVLRKIES